jgi:hypothetical protein
MSRYEKIAREEDDDRAEEMLDVQIEELNKLKRYEYFWRGFNWICCNDADFCNNKLGPVHRIDSKITGVWRCLCYILFLPFILVYLIWTIIKKGFNLFVELPNGKRKKTICFCFVLLVIISIIAIIVLVIIVTLFSQRALIDEYLVRVSFSKIQSISDAVAQLKKNDLQEIFRELLFLDALITLPITNEAIFSSYI